MSARIPVGFAEAWWRFTSTGAPRDMLSACGVALQVGVVPSQAGTDSILNTGRDELDALISSSYSVLPFKVVWGLDGGDATFLGTGSAAAGTRATSAVPPNTAILVKKTTSTPGRRGRGRMFIPGLQDNDVTSIGQLPAPTVTALQTAINAFQTALIATSEVASLRLFHNSSPFDPSEITSLVIDITAATQRRRLRG